MCANANIHDYANLVSNRALLCYLQECMIHGYDYLRAGKSCLVDLLHV